MGNLVSSSKEDSSEETTSSNQLVVNRQPTRTQRRAVASTYQGEHAVEVDPKTKVYLSDSCNCDNCTCCIFCPTEPQQLLQ